ncbi:MAG: 50S ribosomal protein L11 methyltransferase [Thermodesulfobacteriota bacterium]
MSPDAWLCLTVEPAADLLEPLAARLGARLGGVEIRGGCILAYLAEGPELAAQEARLLAEIQQLAATAPDLPPPLVRRTRVAAEDWGRNWQAFFKASRVSPRLVVKPSWEAFPAAPGDVILELDPGMAFGTGLHATTRLLLEALDEALAPGQPLPARALDLGTGTGILAMAAAGLGVPAVVALDNDPLAVEIAAANVAANSLASRVRVSGEDLADSTGPFDLILANITQDVLLELSVPLAARLAPGGRLLLSGLLAGGQEERVSACYQGLGLTETGRRFREEWAALTLRR